MLSRGAIGSRNQSILLGFYESQILLWRWDYQRYIFSTVSSPIANISAALNFDAVETAILTSFALASAVAIAQCELASVDNVVVPESFRPTVLAETVRPRKGA